ncbi:MAG: PorT family protein [Bacteroidetes bacterium]|nr:PorT family protein [Bacteroidota bacterium]
MKKIAISFFALVLLALQADAQIRFGLRAGLSSSNLDRETISNSGVSVAIKDAKYGYHFGIFGRVSFNQHWYLQPEAMFNSNSVDFEVDDFSSGFANTVLTEKYQQLDLPLMLGYKLGPLRVEGGPTGHLHIASKSELEQIGSYDRRFSNFNLGYQAGVGLDIWKLLVDLRYEGNFNKFGDHMNIGGEQVNFSQTPARWLLTVGFSF